MSVTIHTEVGELKVHIFLTRLGRSCSPLMQIELFCEAVPQAAEVFTTDIWRKVMLVYLTRVARTF